MELSISKWKKFRRKANKLIDLSSFHWALPFLFICRLQKSPSEALQNLLPSLNSPSSLSRVCLWETSWKNKNARYAEANSLITKRHRKKNDAITPNKFIRVILQKQQFGPWFHIHIFISKSSLSTRVWRKVNYCWYINSKEPFWMFFNGAIHGSFMLFHFKVKVQRIVLSHISWCVMIKRQRWETNGFVKHFIFIHLPTTISPWATDYHAKIGVGIRVSFQRCQFAGARPQIMALLAIFRAASVGIVSSVDVSCFRSYLNIRFRSPKRRIL